MTKPATQSNQTNSPLEQKEMDELNRFLLSDATSDQTMMLDCLDGYLTAIVIGPTLVPASEWLPGVWGLSARDEPAFETREQAQHILGLIMRHIRGIVSSLEHDPDQFKPVFDRVTFENDTREYLDGEMWAQGFLRGVKLREQEWKPFLDDSDNAAVLHPIRLLGAEEVSAEDEALVATPAQREALTQQIPASVAAMYRYWLPQSKESVEQMTTLPFRRDQPKTGRNDPCPCGSGKKFKKCCGATPTQH